MMKNNYTCIFGGGAIRGVAYIGAMKALKELGITFDKFVGSSVGAIFAALYVFGYSFEETKEIMLDFNAFMFKDLHFGFGADFALSKGEIFENWIRENLEKIFYKDNYIKGENPPVKFRDIEQDLYICTTDLNTNSQFIFSKKNTPDFEIAKAVRISSSFPGLMTPVEYEDKFLVDGDLAKSLPLWKCSEDLISPDSRILEFRLEGTCVKPKSTIDYLNAVYSAMSNFSTENIVKTYEKQDKIDYIVINVKDVLMLDFQLSAEKRMEISQNGYDTTMNYFTNNLVEKKKFILPFYKKTLQMLQELKTVVKKGSVHESKEVLLKYFADFNEYNQYLDFSFVEEMNKIKKSLLADMQEKEFFIFPKITNKTEHSKVIQGLIEKCGQKVSEMEEYLSHFDVK